MGGAAHGPAHGSSDAPPTPPPHPPLEGRRPPARARERRPWAPRAAERAALLCRAGVNPLDGSQAVLKEGSGVFQYFVKVVPTTYHFSNGNNVDSCQ